MKKILFTGGGSAGHVVPNLALIDALKKRGAYEIFYAGTNGIEKRLLAPTGIPFFEISCPKLVRSFTLKNFAIPFSLYKAIRDSRKILQKIRPDLVFSKGGFVSLPVCLAAAKEKIPVLTHESDLSPGLATKLIAKKCRSVLTSFPETAEKLKNGKFVGSPLRDVLFTADKEAARRKYRLNGGKKTILAFGGGSGSMAINEAIFCNLPALTEKYNVIHILGEKNAKNAPVRAGYQPIAYAENMGEIYVVTDLAIARAGSNTLFELAAMRLPSLIVPLQKGSRGDQAENAAYFERRGLIRTLDESRLQQDLLSAAENAMHDTRMAESLKNCPFDKNGNEKILREIESILGEEKA